MIQTEQLHRFYGPHGMDGKYKDGEKKKKVVGESCMGRKNNNKILCRFAQML